MDCSPLGSQLGKVSLSSPNRTSIAITTCPIPRTRSCVCVCACVSVRVCVCVRDRRLASIATRFKVLQAQQSTLSKLTQWSSMLSACQLGMVSENDSHWDPTEKLSLPVREGKQKGQWWQQYQIPREFCHCWHLMRLSLGMMWCLDQEVDAVTDSGSCFLDLR
jgi:hypothetical protein